MSDYGCSNYWNQIKFASLIVHSEIKYCFLNGLSKSSDSNASNIKIK